MREIKFRAWHPELKKMFSPEEMGKDQLTLMPDGRGFVNVSSVSTRMSTFAGDKMIPLQFTGLTDKNGVEIYEGDIYDWGGSILFVEYSKLHACYDLIGKRGSEQTRDLLTKGLAQSCVRIGNIHQNPELLK